MAGKPVQDRLGAPSHDYFMEKDNPQENEGNRRGRERMEARTERLPGCRVVNPGNDLYRLIGNGTEMGTPSNDQPRTSADRPERRTDNPATREP